MIRVYVCDDHEDEPRDAIDRISAASERLGGEKIEIADQARTAQAGFRGIATTRFDIVLIDLFLPVRWANDRLKPPAGPWLAHAILKAYPALGAPLVMWTNNVESTLEHRNQSRAFRHHGGTQIMDKVDPPDDQLKTLAAALAGEQWQPPPDDLTEAEREVLAYYAAGRRADEIGQSTYRAESTVEAYTTAIRRKLLPVPTPPGMARGFGPVLAVTAGPESRVSWLPVEHLQEPTGIFAEIDKG